MLNCPRYESKQTIGIHLNQSKRLARGAALGPIIFPQNLKNPIIPPFAITVMNTLNNIQPKTIFVSANSHRARAKLTGKYSGVVSYYRVFGTSKGHPYVYSLTEEQAKNLKENPITGCAKVRDQDPEHYGKCWGGNK